MKHALILSFLMSQFCSIAYAFTTDIPSADLSAYAEATQLALGRAMPDLWCDLASSGPGKLTATQKFGTTFSNYTSGSVNDQDAQPILTFSTILENKRKLEAQITTSADFKVLDQFKINEYSPIRINVGTIKNPKMVDDYRLEGSWGCHR